MNYLGKQILDMQMSNILGNKNVQNLQLKITEARNPKGKNKCRVQDFISNRDLVRSKQAQKQVPIKKRCV